MGKQTNKMMENITKNNITINYFPDYGFDSMDSNFDIDFTYNGKHYFATFFTYKNIKSLMLKNKKTGENCDGLYIRSDNMIIVDEINLDVVFSTLTDLINNYGELGLEKNFSME